MSESLHVETSHGPPFWFSRFAWAVVYLPSGKQLHVCKHSSPNQQQSPADLGLAVVLRGGHVGRVHRVRAVVVQVRVHFAAVRARQVRVRWIVVVCHSACVSFLQPLAFISARFSSRATAGNRMIVLFVGRSISLPCEWMLLQCILTFLVCVCFRGNLLSFLGIIALVLRKVRNLFLQQAI